MNFDLFNEKSKILINDAQNKAISLNHQQIDPEHLLKSILIDKDSFIKEILENCNVNISNLKYEIDEIIERKT